MVCNIPEEEFSNGACGFFSLEDDTLQLNGFANLTAETDVYVRVLDGKLYLLFGNGVKDRIKEAEPPIRFDENGRRDRVLIDFLKKSNMINTLFVFYWQYYVSVNHCTVEKD